MARYHLMAHQKKSTICQKIGKQLKQANEKVFIVRTAGGAASQILGLINAIKIQLITDRDFRIEHNALATGAYYPFAIKSLLTEYECQTNINQNTADLLPGEFITSPEKLILGYIKEILASMTRKIGIFKIMQTIKGYWSIDGKYKNLDRPNKRFKTLSFGYLPIVDYKVRENLSNRIQNAKIPNFVNMENNNEIIYDVVIHLRLGDKRNIFNAPKNAKGILHGVVNPESFKQIFNLENLPIDSEVYVVSDEPLYAMKILSDAGFKNIKFIETKSFWEDLFIMSKSRILICSWSTVGQIAISLCSNKFHKVYYPKVPGNLKYTPITSKNFQNVKYYAPSYFQKGDGIYENYSNPINRKNDIYSIE